MKLGQKKVPSAVVIIFLLTICVLLGSFFYINFLEKQFDTEDRENLKQETEQIGENVCDSIDNIFENLRYLSEYIVKEEPFDCQRSIEKLNLIKTGEVFKKIGVADSKGAAYLTNGTTINVSEEEFFKHSMQGEKYITDTMVDDENEQTNIYSMCVYENGKCAGVIFAESISKPIENSMEVAEGKLNGNCDVISQEGFIIFGTAHRISPANDNNFFDFLEGKTNEKSIKQLRKNLKNNQSGFINVKYEGKDAILYFESLNINDWYLVAMQTKYDIDSKRDETLFQSNVLIAIFLVLYLITIIFIIYIQERNQKHIEKLAYVDELTGGNSFSKFKQDADKIVRNTTEQYALVDVDIDKFKYINDIFGYEEGNNVIRFIWDEIHKIMEPGETFAHYRADQFVLLMKANDTDYLIKRMEELYGSITKRDSENEKNYEIVLSMGIYIIDRINFRIDTAIDRAALTKKSIKGRHSQMYAVYDEEIRQKVLKEQEIENMMERALKNEEFKVYYQPKYDSNTCKLAGAEALVRWYNDEIGMIFPNEFIGVFENNGFIAELDEYMFEHVCRDIRAWLDEGYQVVPVSVNLSQLQLYNLRFIEDYKAILDKYEIPPEYVQLELTETTLFSKANSLNKIIDDLHKIGFKILMDDFGTGYSSLNMLKNVPVDILKLDKSFVDDIGEPKGDIVVSTIVSLGQLLNMKIVAEGVETKEQFEFLRTILCDEIQGYYFSKPIPENEYRKEMIKGES